MTLPRSDVGWNEDWNLYLYVFDKDLQKCTEMHLPVCLPESGSKVVGLPLKRLFRRREKNLKKKWAQRILNYIGMLSLNCFSQGICRKQPLVWVVRLSSCINSLGHHGFFCIFGIRTNLPFSHIICYFVRQ